MAVLHHILKGMTEIEPSSLSGRLLVAMPGMGGPRFEQAVIYMCAHSEEGAMGLIVNKPAPEVSFADLLEQLKITRGPDSREVRIYHGGPVEAARGFVLHSADYRSEGATMPVTDEIGLTATLDVLEELARGRGPSSSLLALGYSGWGPGQLESEIARNGWLTCAARSDLVFGRASEHKWTAALKSLGIDPLLLSGEAGRA